MNKVENHLDFSVPFTIDFNLLTGLSVKRKPSQRKLSDMKGMFYDEACFERMLQGEDALVYEFYELGAPNDAGDLDRKLLFYI